MVGDKIKRKYDMKISYFGLQSDIIEIIQNSVENTMTEDVLYVFSN